MKTKTNKTARPKVRLSDFDTSVHLRNPRIVFQTFLECLEEGDAEAACDVLIGGLRYMNKSHLEKRYRIPRRTIYNLMDRKSQPGLDMVAKVCHAIKKESVRYGSLKTAIMKRAVLEAQPDGGYTAYIPSLPGCVSEGDTLADARRNIIDALRGYLVVANGRLPKRT